MDLLTWPENPKIFKRFYSDSAYEWYYGVNPVIRLKANPLVGPIVRANFARRSRKTCGTIKTVVGPVIGVKLARMLMRIPMRIRWRTRLRVPTRFSFFFGEFRLHYDRFKLQFTSFELL